MNVYFGTVTRSAPIAKGGEVVGLDWDTKEIVSRGTVEPDPRWAAEDNPRGGDRGCRGVRVTADRVFALGSYTIHEMDRALQPIEDHSHGLMVALHEASRIRDGRIWVASTRINAALEYDLHTGDLVRSFFPREMPSFQSAFSLTPQGIDPQTNQRGKWQLSETKEDASHLHLNAVVDTGDRVLALFNRFGAIVDLTEGRVIVRDTALERGHNLEVLDDGTLVSVDTHGRTVRFYDPDEGVLVQVVDLMSFPWVRELRRSVRRSGRASIAKPLFTRGLAFDGNRLLVGTSPATILMVDWHSGHLLDVYQHSEDVRVAVHGLAIAPGI